MTDRTTSLFTALGFVRHGNTAMKRITKKKHHNKRSIRGSGPMHEDNALSSFPSFNQARRQMQAVVREPRGVRADEAELAERRRYDDADEAEVAIRRPYDDADDATSAASRRMESYNNLVRLHIAKFNADTEMMLKTGREPIIQRDEVVDTTAEVEMERAVRQSGLVPQTEGALSSNLQNVYPKMVEDPRLSALVINIVQNWARIGLPVKDASPEFDFLRHVTPYAHFLADAATVSYILYVADSQSDERNDHADFENKIKNLSYTSGVNALLAIPSRIDNYSIANIVDAVAHIDRDDLFKIVESEFC